jgi:hypothetical protein
MLSHRISFYVFNVILAGICMCGGPSATETALDTAITPVSNLFSGKFAVLCQLGGVGFGLFQMISKGAFVTGLAAIVGILGYNGIKGWLDTTYTLMI